jgi:metallo-beta-lactamase family protein
VVDAALHLGEIIRRVAGRGGKILIPAFALGRVAGNGLRAPRALPRRQDPAINMYVDSPLAVEATTVFRMHPELFDRREQMLEHSDTILDFSLLKYIRAVEDSKRSEHPARAMIVIAASAWRKAGRILHHLANGIGDPKNCVLFVGFQAENTLGRRIMDGNRQVKILGEMHEVRAEIESISGYSAHADRKELRSWVKMLGGPIRRAFVVHGEAGPALAMSQILKEEGVEEIVIPSDGAVVRPVRRAPPLGRLAHGRRPAGLRGLVRLGLAGESARPAEAVRCDRGAGRRAVQRPPVSGPQGPGSTTPSISTAKGLRPSSC